MSTTIPTLPETPESPPRAVARRWGAPTCFGAGYAANTAMLWIASRLLWLGYVLVWFAAVYFFLMVPRARRASARYLDRVLGRRNPLTRAWHTYRHMVTYGILLLDRALMLARKNHGFHVSCDGLLHLRAAADRADATSTGIVLLTAHFGMAEIAAPYFQKMGITRPVNIVMYQDPADGTEAFHSRHRHMFEHISVISTTDPLAAGVKIMRALKNGEVVAMRADRTLAGKGVPVTLLGDPLQLPAGPFLAAALSQAPVIYVYTCRIGYRNYRCTITAAPPIIDGTRSEQIAQAATAFAQHLEKTLRERPLQWGNFFDLWQTQPVT